MKNQYFVLGIKEIPSARKKTNQEYTYALIAQVDIDKITEEYKASQRNLDKWYVLRWSRTPINAQKASSKYPTCKNFKVVETYRID